MTYEATVQYREWDEPQFLKFKVEADSEEAAESKALDEAINLLGQRTDFTVELEELEELKVMTMQGVLDSLDELILDMEFKGDVEALKAIWCLVRYGHWKKAYEAIRNLDTYVRERVEADVYQYTYDMSVMEGTPFLEEEE